MFSVALGLNYPKLMHGPLFLASTHQKYDSKTNSQDCQEVLEVQVQNDEMRPPRSEAGRILGLSYCIRPLDPKDLGKFLLCFPSWWPCQYKW